MYEIADYVSVNELGTAVLLQAMQNRPIARFVVASSMSIYGEGTAEGADGAVTAPAPREPERLASGHWDPRDATGAPTRPLPTSETHVPNLASIYAINKYAQERLCLVFGRAYKIPTVALRFFNVYGPGQALSNPYTGVLAIFASRLLNGKPPLIFEDGRQLRDFVHVRDVARACLAALQEPAADGQAINVGTGQPRTVLEVAEELARAVGRPELRPEITGRYRLGDIRHCYADTRLAREALGFAAREDFSGGLAELAGWLRTQVAVDRVEQATSELSRRGLVA
jgi:dTDP-L-rhamnose 4-epimerase